MDEDRKVGYIKKSIALGILISLSSFVVILYLTVTEETVKALVAIHPGYLIAAIIVHISTWVVWSVKLKVLTGATGNHLRLVDALKMVVTSVFAAAITPSHVGGEPVRIYMLTKSVRISDATAIIFCERFLDLIFLILMAPLGLFIFKDYIFHNLNSGFFAFLCLAVLLIVLVLTLVVSLFRWPEWYLTGLYKLLRHIKGQDKAKKLIDMVRENLYAFITSMKRFIKEGRREVIVALICTVVYWAMEFFIVSLILMGLDSPPAIVHVFAAQVILMLFILIPLSPGCSGVAEFGFSALFALFVESSILGIVVILWRLITYYQNLIVGGVVGLSILKAMNEKR